jgi:hypothetical protein
MDVYAFGAGSETMPNERAAPQPDGRHVNADN